MRHKTATAISTAMIPSTEAAQTMDTTTAATSTALLFGHDGSWWDFWMLISVGAVALAGISVLIFTAGSVMVHKRETAAAEGALERYKLETAGKVADAKAEGIAAGKAAGDATARASEADERAARANERAAALEKEAAAANERTAQVMKATAWRQLSAEQRRIISEALTTGARKIRLMWIANDTESLGLATQLGELLNAAHWDIWIPDSPDTSTTKLLRDAFSRAGLRIHPDPLPPTSMSMGGGGADLATILVASKRPTLARAPD